MMLCMLQEGGSQPRSQPIQGQEQGQHTANGILTFPVFGHKLAASESAADADFGKPRSARPQHTVGELRPECSPLNLFSRLAVPVNLDPHDKLWATHQ